MKKAVVTFFSIFLVTTLLAEIKQVQVKVNDPNSAEKLFTFGSNSYSIKPTGGFSLSNNVSNMLPVKDSRVCTFRLPLIRGQEHEMIIVGPFVDWCNEIKVLSDGVVIGTINGTGIQSKGVRAFFILRDYEERNEGYIHFKIPASITNRARGTNIVIKIGNGGTNDEIDCKIIDRREVEAILVTGTNQPSTSTSTISGVRRSTHVFSKNTNYEITFKIANSVGGQSQSLPTDFGVQLYNGSSRALFTARNKSCSKCTNLFLGNNDMTLVDFLGTPRSAIKWNFSSGNEDFIQTRSQGQQLLLADASVGNWVHSDIPRDKPNPLSLGQTFDAQHEPNDWGGYIYFREMSSLYRFGRYTDLYNITIGNGDDCTCNLSSGGGTPILIGGGSNVSTNPVGNNPAPVSSIDISLSNVFTFVQGSATTSDVFNGVTNVCLLANDPNPKVTTVAPLRVTILNNGTTTITGPLTVKFKLNGTTLATNTIAGNVAANNSVNTTFNRAENRICATRSTQNAAVCKRCGNGILGIPYWEDKGLVIEILNAAGTVLGTKTIN